MDRVRTMRELRLKNIKIRDECRLIQYKLFEQKYNEYERTYITWQHIKKELKPVPRYLHDHYIDLLKGLKKDIECPICFDIIDLDDIYIEFCGHPTHRACNLKWRENDNDIISKCIVCRRD